MFLKKKKYEINEKKKKISAYEKKLEVLLEKKRSLEDGVHDLLKGKFSNVFEFELRDKSLKFLYESLAKIEREILNIEALIEVEKESLKLCLSEKKMMEKFKEKKQNFVKKQEEKKEMGLLDDLSNRSSFIK